jgi:hypothetical protein
MVFSFCFFREIGDPFPGFLFFKENFVPVNFYAYRHDAVDSEPQLMDVFLGPEPPDLESVRELHTFTELEELHQFLQDHNADQIWIFWRHFSARESADVLHGWIEKNLLKQCVVKEEFHG